MEHINNNLQSNIEILSFQSMAGYVSHFNQPMFVANLDIKLNNFSSDVLELFDTIIKREIPNYKDFSFDKEINLNSIIQRILIIIYEIMKMALIPIFNSGIAKIYGNKIELLLPDTGYEEIANKNVVTWVVNIFNQCLNNSDNFDNFETLLSFIKQSSPKGTNVYLLLKSANTLEIPWRNIHNNLFQFGWGSRSFLLDSTVTQKTSALAVSLACNKLATSKVLKSVGIPVSEYIEINSIDEIPHAISKLKYPVVIKPSNLEAGYGVAAGLKTLENTQKAYLTARKLSSSIMMEKHFEGNEYRIFVFDSKVYYATQRIPGGVIGDGENSINDLIKILNEYRKKIKSKSPALIINEEAMDLLNEMGYNLNTIPKKGESVRLRRIANVSVGGTMIPVTDLRIIHKDNIDLVVRAANVLRLDVAGIDLIIPNISVSWLESGAIINEVNSQPQVSREDILCHLLKSSVQKKGRIPIILSLSNKNELWIEEFIKKAQKEKKQIGVVSSSFVSIDNKIVSKSSFDAVSGGSILLNNPIVDIVLFLIDDLSMLNFGLPVDSFDLMICENKDIENEYFRFLFEYSKMCKGNILIDKDFSECLSFAKEKIDNKKIMTYGKNHLTKLLLPTLKL